MPPRVFNGRAGPPTGRDGDRPNLPRHLRFAVGRLADLRGQVRAERQKAMDPEVHGDDILLGVPRYIDCTEDGQKYVDGSFINNNYRLSRTTAIKAEIGMARRRSNDFMTYDSRRKEEGTGAGASSVEVNDRVRVRTSQLSDLIQRLDGSVSNLQSAVDGDGGNRRNSNSNRTVPPSRNMNRSGRGQSWVAQRSRQASGYFPRSGIRKNTTSRYSRGTGVTTGYSSLGSNRPRSSSNYNFHFRSRPITSERTNEVDEVGERE